MNEETVINTGRSLNDLVHDVGLFKTAQKNIRIQFDNLSDQENLNLQDRVKKYYNACGCSQGKATGIITLLVFLVLLLTGVISLSELGIAKTILYYFGFSFITMLIGKLMGLWYARHQLMSIASKFI